MQVHRTQAEGREAKVVGEVVGTLGKVGRCG